MREEFSIRITKKGEIILEVEGMSPLRIKDLLKHFEETLGPVRVVERDSGDASGRVELEDEVLREFAGETEEEKERQRLRERGPGA